MITRGAGIKFDKMNERQVVLNIWEGLNRNMRGELRLPNTDPEEDSLRRLLKLAVKCEKARDHRSAIVNGDREDSSEAGGSRNTSKRKIGPTRINPMRSRQML